MNQSVQNRWEALRDDLLKELGNDVNVSACIPGWPPTNINQALHWMKSSIYEGFYVAFRIERSAKLTTVLLKKWEFGEDEPNWPHPHTT